MAETSNLEAFETISWNCAMIAQILGCVQTRHLDAAEAQELQDIMVGIRYSLSDVQGLVSQYRRGLVHSRFYDFVQKVDDTLKIGLRPLQRFGRRIFNDSQEATVMAMNARRYGLQIDAHPSESAQERREVRPAYHVNQARPDRHFQHHQNLDIPSPQQEVGNIPGVGDAGDSNAPGDLQEGANAPYRRPLPYRRAVLSREQNHCQRLPHEAETPQGNQADSRNDPLTIRGAQVLDANVRRSVPPTAVSVFSDDEDIALPPPRTKYECYRFDKTGSTWASAARSQVNARRQELSHRVAVWQEQNNIQDKLRDMNKLRREHIDRLIAEKSHGEGDEEIWGCICVESTKERTIRKAGRETLEILRMDVIIGRLQYEA